MEFRINDIKIVATTFLSRISEKNPNTIYDFIEVSERQFIIKPSAKQPVQPFLQSIPLVLPPVDQTEKERRSAIARRAVATRKANQLKNA